MFQTKCTKAIMKYVTQSTGDKDGFYYMMDFQHTSGFDVREVEASAIYLVQEGLLKQPFPHRPDIVMPTVYGIRYGRYQWHRIRHFIIYSIFTPIVVSVLTTLITLYITGR